MDELNKEDWENIIELLDMGASYDNNGCNYAANEEKNEHDIKLMNSYRKLKAALA